MAEIFYYNNAATRLPPPSKVLAYDPTQHLYRRNHIATIPNEPRALLRWWPRHPDKERVAGSILQDSVRHVQQHLHALEDLSEGAISVPSHYTLVEHLSAFRSPAVVTVAEFVKGTELGPREAAGLPVIFGLLRYLDWLAKSRSLYMMSDIFSHQQYLRKGNHSYLVDLDPLSLFVTKNGLRENRGMLSLWHNRLPGSVRRQQPFPKAA